MTTYQARMATVEIEVEVTGAPIFTPDYNDSPIFPETATIIYWIRADGTIQSRMRIRGPKVKKDGTRSKTEAEWNTPFKRADWPAWMVQVIEDYAPRPPYVTGQPARTVTG